MSPSALLIALLAVMLSIAYVTARSSEWITVTFASFRRRGVVTMGSRVPSPEGMPILPPDVVKYSQVPAKGKGKGGHFTHDSIPKGLLNQHTTKKGTWGVIRVNRGKLMYQIDDPMPTKKFELTPDSSPGIIEPTKRHCVASLSEDLEFCVEFYRLPGTGPVDEKRE